MSKLSHIDGDGNARMVDVSDKAASIRIASASGVVSMSAELVDMFRRQALPKGDVLTVARIAGIQAAKRTAELIPLCHTLLLSKVAVDLEVTDTGVRIEATVKTTDRTGVEMEALTAVSVAALTVYDMCKAVDRSMEIGSVRLEAKTGGRSGEWGRS